MQMSGAAPDGAERRAHPRVLTRFNVHCRRLGRGGIDEDVEVVDLSMGGIRITAPGELQSGDVVELTIHEGQQPLTLSGLVVGTSPGGGVRYSHIAFTRLVPTTLEHIGALVDRKAEV
jgi:hypothetical protein